MNKEANMHYRKLPSSTTALQREYLRRLGVIVDEPRNQPPAQLGIDKARKERRDKGRPSERQEWFLKQRCRWRDGMTWAEADQLIDQIKAAERAARQPGSAEQSA
jgi:hypothetical protein